MRITWEICGKISDLILKYDDNIVKTAEIICKNNTIFFAISITQLD